MLLPGRQASEFKGGRERGRELSDVNIVKIFTKVPYLRQCYYTGSEDKESFCLTSVGKYGS